MRLRRLTLDAPAATPRVRMTRVARLALRVVRRVGRAVDRSPFAFLGAFAVVQRARNRRANAADVLAVLEALSRAGVRGWLAGGWGVDALLGVQTRRHEDIDVVLAWEDGAEERARRALAALGFRSLHDEVVLDGRSLPVRWVLDDGLVVVDLLPVDLTRRPFAQMLKAPRRAAPVVAARAAEAVLEDRGVIAGHPVPCLPLRLQLLLHQGYPARASDRHDLGLLEGLWARQGGAS